MFFAKVVSIVSSLWCTHAIAAEKHSQHAHEHGAAKLDVVVEASSLSVGLEAPGDSIFGFEHMPKTDAEKKVVADALQTLRTKPLDLFVLPADLGCALKSVTVEAAQEGVTNGAGKGEPSAHRDVDYELQVTCQKPLAGSVIKLTLFSAFPRLKSLKAQVLSGANQTGVTLTKDKFEIKL